MRLALGIEYDGTDFSGWQRLSHGRSVQGDVEAALSFVADHPVEVTCAGRTDAGVHARCQVVHFDTEAVRSERAWMLGTNSRLGRDVAVIWAQPVAAEFHARFGARARRYRYTILNRPIRAALAARFVAWERVPLEVEPMQRAAAALIGEHDFSAFRTAQCQANSPMREVREIAVSRHGDEVAIEIEANAFLHHMVRNIVGSLLPIGRGERPPQWLGELLRGRDRNLAGPTAPAGGLTFLAPRYPAQWNLPAAVTL
ncbi:tRNA pseudouridine(38-40) synthase TruA [Dokdonella sp.]|uniref:tRNA pseudouridine(38-40) synthase TruA n=1 Tax=Dokdonella sp. TaxID=2291710 RepID=UPI001B0E46A2|nr:tRNA pseudouridine(38-40) synthase TruA [Dokdonella sp.]MBO9664842.1 tRNA pseudouridine(38-40) synthase TruA [Dokdonella sp.]